MPKLNREGLKDAAAWQKAGVKLPAFDIDAMAARTKTAPRWVHFGAGNIFRCFLAACQQELLEAGMAETGIIAVKSADSAELERFHDRFDNMTLSVAAGADGALDLSIVASVAESVVGDPARPEGWMRMKELFAHPGLQMATFTITEKGYALTGPDGALQDAVKKDMENGPAAPSHLMARVAALMLHRFENGAQPMSLVSLDNCSHNGEKLQNAVGAVADAWTAAGFCTPAFAEWLRDPSKVGFPWSMIDKIVPRPSEDVKRQLEAKGIEEMDIVVTGRGSWIAPFVNAEPTRYLFCEDAFPNGRPPLHECRSVWFTARETVTRVETMKVTTCLNPLHTAIAVTGRLLGHEMVFEAMKDPQILALVKRIGYVEGLPVVVDPGVIRPVDFLDDCVNNRFVNPYIPDQTRRIASDTSMKVGIRFGETIKAYRREKPDELKNLVGIPLAIAAWLRYLLGVDDAGEQMEISPDPNRVNLQLAMKISKLGGKSAELSTILVNETIFGSNLYEAGLGGKIQSMYMEMLAGPGAVRATLKKHLG